MATIITKNSSTPSSVPTAGDLEQGELAVNVADKRLFTEDSTGSVVELGTNPSSITTSTVDIDGGTIDGVTIATSDVTVGSGKTLDVSAGTLTLANDQISGDAIDGGTATPTTVTSTTVNATTVDSTNIEVTNLKAKDGTSAGSIADSTGVVTLASSVLTTTDVNGGTVDNTVIGGTTPAAGSFTTGDFSGDVTASSGKLSVTQSASSGFTAQFTGGNNTQAGISVSKTVGGTADGFGLVRIRAGNAGDLLINGIEQDGVTEVFRVLANGDIQGNAFSVDYGTTYPIDASGNIRSFGAFSGYGAPSTLTIATGVVTATGSHHVIAAESGTADDLDTINGGTNGDRLVVRPDAGDTITFKDGTGNLLLSGDFAANDATDTLELLCLGGNWVELSRSNNT